MVTFEMAGIRARASAPAAAVERRLRPFAGAGRPDVVIDLRPRRRPRRRPDIRMRGRRLDGPHLGAEWRGDRITGWISPTVPAWDALLKAVWSRLLVERGGMLLHASAAVVGGAAWVFPGPSGAGKSTLARKAPHRLADDTVAIADGRAHGLPFGRRPSPPESWPLRAFGFCRKHSTGVEPLTRAAARARLWRNVVWFSDEFPPLAAVDAPAVVIGSRLHESFDAIMERARAAV